MKSLVVSLTFLLVLLQSLASAYAADRCNKTTQRTPTLERAEIEAAEAEGRFKSNPSSENAKFAASTAAQLAVETAVNTPSETIYDTTLAQKLKVAMGGSYLDLTASAGQPREMHINPGNGSGVLFYIHDPKTVAPSRCIDGTSLPISTDLCNVLVSNSLVTKVSCLSDEP